MKKIVPILLAMLVFPFAFAQITGVRIDQYPNAASQTGTERIPEWQGNAVYDTTPLQLAQYAALQLTGDCTVSAGFVVTCIQGREFGNLLSGTNTNMQAVCSTGCSIDYSLLGIIDANRIAGGDLPLNAPLTGTDAGGRFYTVTPTGCVTVLNREIYIAAPIDATNPSTVTLNDACGLVAYSTSSNLNVTVPQGGQFGANFSFDVVNEGTGLLTLTPQTGTIAGLPNVKFMQGQGAEITSDGVNEHVSLGQTYGPTFTVSGCNASSPQGDKATGSFKIGVASCTVTVTYGAGWAHVVGVGCIAWDLTNPVAVMPAASYTTTTASFNIPSNYVPGDVVFFHCWRF